MTLEERMAQLEQRVAYLEGRVASLEAKNMTIGPGFNPPTTLPNIPPTNPWPKYEPWNPPYTITCKMQDGSTQEIKLDGPIVAYSDTREMK